MAAHPERHSLLALPGGAPFAVPSANRFREGYYWDSLFSIQGLLVCGLVQLSRVRGGGSRRRREVARCSAAQGCMPRRRALRGLVRCGRAACQAACHISACCTRCPSRQSILDNLLSAVEAHGFVPNGLRCYYLNRSQPPLLSQVGFQLSWFSWAGGAGSVLLLCF